MNVAGIPGGILAGLLANTLGVGNMMLATAGFSAVLIFALLGVKDAAGIILIAVIYGFFSAICKPSLQCLDEVVDGLAAYALPGPLVSTLTADLSELGFDSLLRMTSVPDYFLDCALVCCSSSVVCYCRLFTRQKMTLCQVSGALLDHLWPVAYLRIL
jgi:hypothetical protein